MGSVVCHTLPLFGKMPFGIISFDFLYDSFTRAFASAFFSVWSCLLYTDPLHNHSSLESAMLRAPVLATIHGCGTNFIVFLNKA